MAEGLEIQRQTYGDVLVLRLAGNITEDSQIDLIAKDMLSKVAIDLHGVRRINSYGIRQWVNVMKEIHRQGHELVFHRCPPAFVEQFNMISNFGGGGTVYSFYLPFYCETCGTEELKLYELPDGRTPTQTPALPSASCSKCTKALAFNDIEDEYFYFLQHQKGKSVDPSIVAVLKKLT